MIEQKTSRRAFLKMTGAGVVGSAVGFSASSYARIAGANDRIRVGVVGFSDRFRSALAPAFMQQAQKLNFELVAVSDIWNRRRDEGVAQWKEKMGHDITGCRNNEELYDRKLADAVFISTADFQHALHAIQAVQAGCDAVALRTQALVTPACGLALHDEVQAERIAELVQCVADRVHGQAVATRLSLGA